MITLVLFAVSGVAIVTITAAKRVEERKRTTVFILRLISLGDERLRNLHHEALRHYSYGKEKGGFWVKKQLPLKLKSISNRFQAFLGEKATEYLGDMRGSRLLKRSDGISEFFKSIREVEKGGGEINETLPILEEDFYIQTSEERHAAQEREAAKLSPAIVIEIEEEPVVMEEAPAPKAEKPGKPRAPRKKRVQPEAEVVMEPIPAPAIEFTPPKRAPRRKKVAVEILD
jgi:hypothetical protein